MSSDQNNDSMLQRRSQRIPVTDFFYMTLSSSPFKEDTKISVKDISETGLKFMTQDTKLVNKGDILSAKLHINSKFILPIKLKTAYIDNEGVACRIANDDQQEAELLVQFLKFLTVFKLDASSRNAKGKYVPLDKDSE